MKQKSSELRNLRRRIDGVTMPISRKRIKWSRNWKCLCGSEKKYKNCCMGEIDNLATIDGNATIQTLSGDIQEMINAHREAEKKKGVGQNG